MMSISMWGRRALTPSFTLALSLSGGCALDEGAPVDPLVAPGAAAQLAFTVPPVTSGEGIPFDPPVQVAVKDIDGQLVTGSDAKVTLLIGDNPSGARLTGTTTSQVVDGVASFPELSVDRQGEGFTLVAISGTLTSALSGPFRITPSVQVADGVFWFKRCRPDEMAFGNTLVYPLEGHVVYWIRNCQVVRLMDMPGRVGVVRQSDDGGVYGLVGSSVLGFAPDGACVLAAYWGQELPSPAHHDVIKTKRGSYMILTKEPLADGAFDDVIVEYRPDLGIVWSWSANLHLLGSKEGSRGLGQEQWIHSNSLDLFPDGDILLSARNLDLIVRIDYPRGVVLWKRGQGILGKQHHANITAEGNIVVFDNGTGRRESGVVMFGPDGQLLLDQRLGFFSDAFGSAEQQANGNWLVVDGRGGRVIEYAPDFSDVVFELKLLRGNYIPYARDPSDPVRAFFYRANRVPLPPVGGS